MQGKYLKLMNKIPILLYNIILKQNSESLNFCKGINLIFRYLILINTLSRSSNVKPLGKLSYIIYKTHWKWLISLLKYYVQRKGGAKEMIYKAGVITVSPSESILFSIKVIFFCMGIFINIEKVLRWGFKSLPFYKRSQIINIT